MFIGALQGALVVSGVLVVLALLRAGSNRPAKRDPKTGELVLQCSPGLVYGMGAMAAGGPLAMGLLSFIIPFQHEAQIFVPIGIGAFFLLIGGSMCLWAVLRRTRVGDKGLKSEYVFFAPTFLPWEQVAKVTFASGQEFWVRGANGQKAMLHVWFRGVKEAVPLLRKHLPEAVKKKNGSTIDQFAFVTGAKEPNPA